MNETTHVFTNDILRVAPLGVVFILIFAVVGLISMIVSAVIYCKISSKTGYHWALGLLMFVPIANMIVPFVLAFSEWPIHKELRRYKNG